MIEHHIYYTVHIIGWPRPVRWYEFRDRDIYHDQYLTLKYTFNSTDEKFIIEAISKRIQEDYKKSKQLTGILDWEIVKH